jgi:hypothetical protein
VSLSSVGVGGSFGPGSSSTGEGGGKEEKKDRHAEELSRGWKIHYLFPGSGGSRHQIDSIRRRQEIAKRI